MLSIACNAFCSTTFKRADLTSHHGAGIHQNLKPDALNDAEVISMLHSLAEHSLGSCMPQAFKLLLDTLQRSPTFHSSLETSEGWQQLLPLASKISTCSALVHCEADWLQDLSPDHGPLSVILPYTLLLCWPPGGTCLPHSGGSESSASSTAATHSSPESMCAKAGTALFEELLRRLSDGLTGDLLVVSRDCLAAMSSAALNRYRVYEGQQQNGAKGALEMVLSAQSGNASKLTRFAKGVSPCWHGQLPSEDRHLIGKLVWSPAGDLWMLRVLMPVSQPELRTAKAEGAWSTHVSYTSSHSRKVKLHVRMRYDHPTAQSDFAHLHVDLRIDPDELESFWLQRVDVFALDRNQAERLMEADGVQVVSVAMKYRRERILSGGSACVKFDDWVLDDDLRDHDSLWEPMFICSEITGA